MDTLDNLGFSYKGKQEGMDFGFAAENSERIRRQNRKKISVIIGNPPYNANQKNENENNKNREYPGIDEDIKNTYIALSTAQKTKVYDMYARFLRWASNRLHKNGVIAFVSNNSFIDSRTYDGFRKSVAKEFNEIYIIDLKGNARTSGERRRKEGGNVFSDEIRVGVAVYFLVRKEGSEGCNVYYNAIKDYASADEKKDYLVENKFKEIKFEHVMPDADDNWINLVSNDFDTLVPLSNKETKQAKRKIEERAIFKLFSLGVVTNRDEWVYDLSDKILSSKIQYLIRRYNSDVEKHFGKHTKAELADVLAKDLKWTRAVKADLMEGKKYRFHANRILTCVYRPFCARKLYYSSDLNEMQYQMPVIFPGTRWQNKVISFNSLPSKPFSVLSSDKLVDLHLVGDSQCLPLYRYDDGDRIENITDWGLEQFRKMYEREPARGGKHRKRSTFANKARKPGQIEKEDIFHYVYGVLHNPAYRKKYELNLRREFPRIPFYDDFWKWASWGKKLMDLHINYEKAKPYPLKRKESGEDADKAKLKADKDKGAIIIDEATTLTGVPVEAWDTSWAIGLHWSGCSINTKKASQPTPRSQRSLTRTASRTTRMKSSSC